MVTCSLCSKQIIDPSDVNVTAFWGIMPRVFCNNCYAARERGLWRHIVHGNQKAPLNSTYSLLALVASTVVFAVVAVLFLFAAPEEVVFNNNLTTTDQFSLWGKLVVLFLVGALVLYGWILFFVARSIVRRVKP